MVHYQDKQKYIVVLAKGEEIIESLVGFAKEENITTAWLSGLGAALEVELGFYDLDHKQYHWETFMGPLEITALTGNFARIDKEPVLHIHGTFTDSEYKAVGGHVKKLVVAATCELFIQKVDHPLTRRLDEEVGLELLEAGSPQTLPKT